MKQPKSLQWRLSLWLGLGAVILLVVTTIVTAQVLRHELNKAFDSALEETAQRILPVAALEIFGRDADDTEQRVATLRRHNEYFTYVVRDANGTVLMRSHNADLSIFPPYKKMGFTTTPTHRLYSDAALQGSLTITVAEPLAHRRSTAGHILFALVLPLAAIVPLGLIGVWLIIRFSMAPVRNFGDQIESRGGGDLNPVAVDRLPSEIGTVAKAVNRLLDRLKLTLEAERSLAAKSAHELRTPVAAALAQAQRLIVEAKDDATRERAQDMETALRRLSRLTEKLMQLARAEGGRLLAEKPVNIAAILRLVVSEFSSFTDAAGRIELTQPDRPVLASIDADAFAILARNLIENALKHGAQNVPVHVSLSAEGILRVINAGAVVPAETLARLSEPFERGQALVRGAGLGLAIAKTIAAGAGGQLAFQSPAGDRKDGFEARFIVANDLVR
ncbi:two-component system OmpR family sensor kinase [Ochrobactrum daejeonense]|uniref:histidine kinase n=1 Tax=Brucella daejeonensis TaxID=659015 RepID=A0A7W9AYT4_9HYPH|nr:ATP-binding protein [Brucella daejeonensis]MBB5703061.1 two-component system OmpR family sensor kinase [Brucella daejeonensis]NKB79260.1 HAMP domain-containing protein [Brucella daejeonensis]